MISASGNGANPLTSLLHTNHYVNLFKWGEPPVGATKIEASLVWHTFTSQVIICVCSVAQSCLTLCNSMDCSPPGSSVHGIFQARTLEWVALPSSGRSSPPRDRTQVSCIAGRFFTAELPGKPSQEALILLPARPGRLCYHPNWSRGAMDQTSER